LTKKQLEFNWSTMDMVRDFVQVTGQKPNVPMSTALINEEYTEWCDGDFGGVEEELKELADLVYVIYGYANVRGWDLDEAIKRVHNNNIGRCIQEDGTIKRREDGKILKNESYPKVNLEDLVNG